MIRYIFFFFFLVTSLFLLIPSRTYAHLVSCPDATITCGDGSLVHYQCEPVGGANMDPWTEFSSAHCSDQSGPIYCIGDRTCNNTVVNCNNTADTGGQSGFDYCQGKVSCPGDQCLIGSAFCASGGDCEGYCGNCASQATPTPVPPTPTPPVGIVCDAPYCDAGTTDCGTSWGVAAWCHPANDPSTGYFNKYCDPNQCQKNVVTPPPGANTPTPTPPNQVCSSAITCNAQITNVTTNSSSKYAIAKSIRGSNPFSSANSITIAPGDVVQLDSNAMKSTGCPFIRSQYMVRDTANQAINDCIETPGNDTGLANFCQNMVGKIAFSRTGNFPNGDGSKGPDGLVPDLIGPITYNEPVYNPFPAFNDTKTYSGTCWTAPIKCCSRGTNPDGTYRCQTASDDNSCDSYIYPTACQVNDNGLVKTMKQTATDRIVRKQFNTPGTYVMEAYEENSGANNWSNPCQVQVVVGTPTPPPVTTVTLTGRLINDNNADAFYDPSAAQGDSIYPANTPGTTVTITSTGSTAGITYTVNADGTYSFANVPIGATYTISVSGIPTSRFFVNNISGQVVPVPSSTPPNIPDIYISRYYTISGIVFNDANKNKIYNPGPLATDDKPYLAGVVTIQQTGQQANVNTATGTYTFDLGYQLRPNTAYTISYNNSAIAPPYVIWIPSYSGIVVGPTCPNLTTQAPSATCATVTATIPADITNLNFAVTNSVAWVQYQGLDVRNETFLNHQTPTTVANVCKDANTGTTNGYGSVGRY